MVETIKYEGVHPVVVCLLNLIFLGGTGYFALGQKRKAIGAWLYTLVLWLVLLGWIPQIIFAIDGYKVADKLKSGQTFEETHNELEWLSRLPFFHD